MSEVTPPPSAPHPLPRDSNLLRRRQTRTKNKSLVSKVAVGSTSLSSVHISVGQLFKSQKVYDNTFFVLNLKTLVVQNFYEIGQKTFFRLLPSRTHNSMFASLMARLLCFPTPTQRPGIELISVQLYLF